MIQSICLIRFNGSKRFLSTRFSSKRVFLSNPCTLHLLNKYKLSSSNKPLPDVSLSEIAPIDFSTIYSERTNVTAQLWKLRENLIKKMNNLDLSNSSTKPTRTPLQLRPPWQSTIVLCYNFKSNPSLCHQYVRFDGGIRFEKVLEDMDALAGNVAQLHAENEDNYPINFVTAAVDRIDLLRRFPMSRDLAMEGHVTYVGNTSLNVRIKIYDKHNPSYRICTANFIMVAKDPYNDKPIPINPLLLETEEDKQEYIRSEYDIQLRKKERSKRLSDIPPTLEESIIIHNFWKDIRNNKISLNNNNESSNIIAMKNTRLESANICQPQELNRAGKIFGGHLMRLAYELARTNAYNFVGIDSHPIFVSSDEITFEYPVTVGSIIRNESYIACTDSSSGKKHAIEVLVRTFIKEANQPNVEILSNLFSFTYIAPTKEVRRVIPESYHESMMYLFGRRGLEQSRLIAVRDGSLLAQYI